MSKCICTVCMCVLHNCMSVRTHGWICGYEIRSFMMPKRVTAPVHGNGQVPLNITKHGLEATFCKETLPELWKPLKCLFHWGETDISEASFLRVVQEGRSQAKRTFQRLHSWGLQMMCLTTNKQPGTRPAHSEGKHMQALNELSSPRCRGCCTVGIVSSLLTQTRYVVHVICLLSSPLEVYFCQWSCG